MTRSNQDNRDARIDQDEWEETAFIAQAKNSQLIKHIDSYSLLGDYKEIGYKDFSNMKHFLGAEKSAASGRSRLLGCRRSCSRSWR